MKLAPGGERLRAADPFMEAREQGKMKSVDFGRCALGICVAAAMLAGCGASQQPIALPGAILQHRLHSIQTASSSYGDLLYVAPDGAGVTYYTYPAGDLVGTLNESGSGLCSDTSGDIFVVNRYSTTEFAHGGTSPINTFSGYGFNYNSCSVDPKTGDLAVAFLGQHSGYPPGVAIFKNGLGRQFTYTDASFENLEYCSYDGSGNLFADGYISSEGIEFAELPAGGKKLKTVRLPYEIRPGQVQWDGQYVTVEDEKEDRIYRLKIKGSVATIVGTTKLHGFTSTFFASWIYNGAVIVPLGKNGVGYVGFWKYPEGGSRTKIFAGPGYHTPDYAVTISPGS